jgi:solute carrier family 25 (mitochondrial phosphate transporter), member 23/24/25/41
MDDTQTASVADAKVDELWATLDMRKQGHLDLAGLKKGLRKLDHRKRRHKLQHGRHERELY